MQVFSLLILFKSAISGQVQATLMLSVLFCFCRIRFQWRLCGIVSNSCVQKISKHKSQNIWKNIDFIMFLHNSHVFM